MVIMFIIEQEVHLAHLENPVKGKDWALQLILPYGSNQWHAEVWWCSGPTPGSYAPKTIVPSGQIALTSIANAAQHNIQRPVQITAITYGGVKQTADGQTGTLLVVIEMFNHNNTSNK